MCTSPCSSQESTAHGWWIEATGKLRQSLQSAGMVTIQWYLPQSYMYCPLMVSSRLILDHPKRNNSTLWPETLPGVYVLSSLWTALPLCMQSPNSNTVYSIFLQRAWLIHPRQKCLSGVHLPLYACIWIQNAKHFSSYLSLDFSNRFSNKREKC